MDKEYGHVRAGSVISAAGDVRERE